MADLPNSYLNSAPKYLLGMAVIAYVALPFCFALYDFIFFLIMRELAITEFLIAIPIYICAFRYGYSIEQIKNLSNISKVIWVIILAVLIIGPLFYTPDIRRSFTMLLILSLGPLIIHITQQDAHKNISFMLKTFVYVMAVYCVVFLVLYTTGLHSEPHPPKTAGTFPGFNSIRHISPLLGAAIMIGVYLFTITAHENKQRLPIFQFCCLSILWAILLFSGTRGGFICMIGGFIITCVLISNHRKNLSYVFLGSALVGVTIALLIPSSNKFLGIMNIFFRLKDHSTANDFSTGRLEIWKAGIQSLRDSPFIGHGIGNFSHSAQYLDDGFRGAHNIIIEYLHALGVIGGFCLFLWIAIQWFKSAQSLRVFARTESLVAFAAVNFLFLYAFLNGLAYRTYSFTLLVILFAIVIANIKPSQKDA